MYVFLYIKLSEYHTLCRLMFFVVGFDSAQVQGDSLCLSFEHYNKVYRLAMHGTIYINILYEKFKIIVF